MTTTTETYHSTQTTDQTNLSIDELVETCCNDLLPSSSQLNSSSVSPTHLVRFVHSQSSLVSQIDESISSQDTSLKQSPFTIRTQSTKSMQNTTNLTNITANNISVNNYNVNIHTTNVQQPTQTVMNSNNEPCSTLNEKQTTEIVTQILKNIKEVEPNSDQQSSSTTNYNIHIDSFNFSSSIDPNKKARLKKEPKALTKIIVKDESNAVNNEEFISVPYGWQRKLLENDLVVYLSPTNTILDSIESIRQYLESPNTCKCGLQCPLIVDKVFNFDCSIKSKSWEVTQVLEGTHCRQKSNILEMATLTNCIDSFCENDQKPALKRRKRLSNESLNGNVFVCTGNINSNSNQESVVLINNNQALPDGNLTPTKRPRGRPRKTAVTSPIFAQLAVKSKTESNCSSSSSTNLRYLNENTLPSTTDTNVLARVPALFDQVKSTTNESTFAVLSGVQNVLLSPNRESNAKRVRGDSASSGVSTTNVSGKQVKLNVNALKPDFVRSPSLSSQKSSNQIDVISLMGANPQSTSIILPKSSANTDESNSQIDPTLSEPSQGLKIDFNDPSTTNFLLSALTSGTSTDSNTIVNQLFQKAQQSNNPSTMMKKPIPILKTCTETTNLLPRSSVVLHVPTNASDPNSINEENKKTHQQIFFINNKPYIIQQKLSNEQKILFTSTEQKPKVNPNPSTLDDGGSCLLLHGAVEPKTLRTLLKGLNASSFSGVDNLIDTIHQFENTNHSTRTVKASPLKKATQPVRKRLTKKMKQEQEKQLQQQQQAMISSQSILVEQQQQQQWQTDFNSFDFSTPWGSDTNLNSLLLNDDFDTAASFDDVNFGDLEPYINGNHDISLSSLFIKSLPTDSLPSVDHLLP